MRTELLKILACPECRTESPFEIADDSEGNEYEISSGKLICRSCQSEFLIQNGIPRFVSLDKNYCENFSFQWQEWRTLQIDRLSGHTLSADRFFRDTEWSRDWLKDKVILDAGCGAGRFADIAAEHGATVIAVDLSDAVEACQKTTAIHGEQVHCLQASLLNLPLRPQTLDGIYCMGVIQHTPEPEAIIRSMPQHLRPGGKLVYNFYEEGFWRRFQVIKYLLRIITPHLSVQVNFVLSRTLVSLFFPVTQFLARIPKVRIFNHLIPIAAMHDPQLSKSNQRAWTLLDTLDWYGARYELRQNHKRVAEQLEDEGMREVRCRPGLVWGTKPEEF